MQDNHNSKLEIGIKTYIFGTALLFFLIMTLPIVFSDTGSVGANLNITNDPPTVTAPIVIPLTAYTNDILNCSGGNYSDPNSDPEGGRDFKWYNNGALVSNITSQLINLSLPGFDHFDNMTCSVRVNDSYIWSSWVNSSNGVVISNSNVTILGTQRTPTSADVTEQINFSIQATDLDGDPLTAYCQLYNDTNPYGSVVSQSITDNVMSYVCNVSPSITGNGDSWHADIWVTDAWMNTSISTTLSVSVGAWVSSINDSTNHTNLTITITFQTAIPTNFTIQYSLDGNVSNLNNTYSDATYSTNHTAIIPINPDYTFYYTITTYTEESGSTESWGPYNTTYSCAESWSCTDWGPCTGGLQTRTCTDANTCGTTTSRPALQQSCATGGGGTTSTYVSREDEIEIPTPLLLPGEPITCGNGVSDEGESYLNCNKDVRPTLLEYAQCIGAGPDSCVYYELYLRTLFVILASLIVGIAIAYSAGGGTSAFGFVGKKKSKK